MNAKEHLDIYMLFQPQYVWGILTTWYVLGGGGGLTFDSHKTWHDYSME